MSDPKPTRRAFLESALGMSALTLLARTPLLAAAKVPAASAAKAAAPAAKAVPKHLRLGLVLPKGGPFASEAAAFAQGARLAAEEAQRTAQLVGGSCELLEGTAVDAKSAAREATRLAETEKALALLGGLDRATRDALTEVAERRHIPFLTARGPGEPIGEEVVQQHLFDLTPGLYDRCRALSRYLVAEAKLASWYFVGLKGEEGNYLIGAAKQGLLHLGGTIAGTTALDPKAASFGPLFGQIAKARPHLIFLALGEPLLSRVLAGIEHENQLAAIPVSGPFSPLTGDGLASPSKHREIWPVVWHPSLVQGGAVQLNQRYQARWKQPMGPYAWMGWVGVKTVAAFALRAPAGTDLAPGLSRIQFDGQKATPLHFDVDHFLRQPIYLVGRKPGEAPPAPLSLLGQVAPEAGS